MNGRGVLSGAVWLAGALWLMAGAAGAGEAAEGDVVQFAARGGEAKTQQGTILKDQYNGITINVGGAQFVVKRHEVIGVPIYREMDADDLKTALGQYQDGAYDEALENFQKLLRTTNSTSEERKILAQQHLVYFLGMCYLKQGDYEKAKTYLESLIAKKPNTFWYFDAMLAQARCLEATSKDNRAVMDRYRFLMGDFKKKADEEKELKSAERAMLMAEFGYLRPQIKEETKKSGNEDKVRGLEGKLDELLKKGKSLLTAEDKSEAVSYQAAIYRYMKKYSELVEILNSAVRDAQMANDRDSLRGMYLERGDAYFGMMQAAKGKEQQELGRRALFDYLRAELVYKLEPDDSARANFGIGSCFFLLRGKDWEEQAMKHLSRAAGRGPFQDKAKQLIEQVKSAKAAADKAAAEKAAAEKKPEEKPKPKP